MNIPFEDSISIRGKYAIDVPGDDDCTVTDMIVDGEPFIVIDTPDEPLSMKSTEALSETLIRILNTQ